MSKKRKYRKLKPSVPNYWWYAIADGCWFCDNKNGCRNCKAAKEFIADKGVFINEVSSMWRSS